MTTAPETKADDGWGVESSEPWPEIKIEDVPEGPSWAEAPGFGDPVAADGQDPPMEFVNGGQRQQLGGQQLGTDGAPKKKKKNKKKKKTGGPTGFEEYTIEGPITKEQAEAELGLYDPPLTCCAPIVISPEASLSLSEPDYLLPSAPGFPLTHPPRRIEICIQRYRQRRKWDEWRLQVFETYLNLGGISTGQKMFVGADPKKFEDMDAEEIATMTATDFVHRPDEDWDVDFAWVVRGLLSWRVPHVLCYNTDEKLALSCNVIKNFLGYVAYHNVCPEHAASIKEAIAICDTADLELGLCKMVSNALPGNFHLALSTLNGGSFAGIVREDFGDAERWDKDIRTTRKAGMTKATAQDVFRAALAQVGTPHERAEGLLAFVRSSEFMSLEVTEIVLPEQVDEDEGKEGYFLGNERLGKLKLRTWNPDEPDEPIPNPEVVEFWLEKSILQSCFLKMHIDCKVYTLNTGMKFFDTTTAVTCSFFLRIDPPNASPDDNDSVEEFD
ncbi:Argonaute siRNA chaperone complex subunit Arb1-domain-containing protein [Geopyxis carbonaria]|nr:Argonaute siRNA chaperone complex subunit Arb1-domain-containing protein [Geopyxis carbonaria]